MPAAGMPWLDPDMDAPDWPSEERIRAEIAKPWPPASPAPTAPGDDA